MSSSPLHRNAVIYWMIALLVVCRVLAALMYHPFDDAFITFRYSQNLAAGNGLVYNVGDWVLGTTAPIYAMLASVALMLGLPLPQTMVVFNILVDVAILYLALRYVLPERTENDRLVFGALYAASLVLGRVCAGAMEVDLYLLTGLVSMILFQRGSRRIAVAVAAAAYYIRPEAVILVAVLCLIMLLKRRWREMFTLAAIAAAVVLPGLIYFQIQYGHFLPHSVIAKSTFPKVPVDVVVLQLLATDWMMIALIPFAIWGAFLIAKRPGIARMIALWGGLHMLAYLVRRPFVWTWYAEVPAFVTILLASIAIASIAGHIAERVRPKIVTWGLRGAAICALLLWAFLFNKHGVSRVESEVFEPLEAWATTTLMPTTTIAAYDIGVIGYFSHAEIFDLAGLVSPEMLEYRSVPEAIEARKSEYVMLVSTREIIGMMSQPSMQQLYRPYRSFPHQEVISMDSMDYRGKWTNNYIVFKRRDL